MRRLLRLSAEARKGAAIAALALFLAVLAAVLPFLWWSDLAATAQQRRAERDLLADRLVRSREAGATRLTASDGVARMFLQGATDGTALAEFQGLMGDVAQRNGLAVLRITPLAGAEAPGRTARLSLEATGSIEALRGFLAEAESMLPLVFVTGMDLAPADGTEGEGAAFPSENLTIGLRLEAYPERTPQ